MDTKSSKEATTKVALKHIFHQAICLCFFDCSFFGAPSDRFADIKNHVGFVPISYEYGFHKVVVYFEPLF